MLAQMTAKDISEWAAYYQVKENKMKAEEKEARASARAKEENR